MSHIFKMLEDGVKEGYIITPDVIEGFNVEQDPMIYGSGDGNNGLVYHEWRQQLVFCI